MNYHAVFGFLWLSMCAFLVIRAIAYTKVEKLFSKRPATEMLLVLLAVLGMGILPLLYITTGWLTPFAFTLPGAFRFLGAVVYAAGLALLFWVHLVLGRNWSPILEIRREHMLITGGPYRFVRHPLYLAFYILAIGQWLLTSNWFIGIAGFFTWTVFYATRIDHEEAMMLEFFGNEYKRYMKQTGRLLPKLR